MSVSISDDYFLNSVRDNIPETETTRLMGKSAALRYHQSLTQYQPTPLVMLPKLAKKYGVGSIRIKDESHRFNLNAFKGLGASYAIHELIKRKPDIETFCTATDGNHGRAVAWAATQAGKKAMIFVPQVTTQNRMDAISLVGGTVIKLNRNYDETCAYAEQQCQQNGWELVQDTAWENYEEIPALIMAGYLTMYQELENSVHQLPAPDVDVVFLQVGVGSWAASAIWYYWNRYGKAKPKLVIVEPAESDGILASLNAKQRVLPSGKGETIMAGLNCGIPSLTAWEIIQNGCDAAMRVTDDEARRTMRELYYPTGSDARIIAGESGVGGMAGFLSVMKEDKYAPLKNHLNIGSDTRVLCYGTEGATDIDLFNRVVQQN